MEILLMFDGLWCGVRGTLDDLDDPERGDTVRHPFFQNVLSVLITVLRFPSIDYCVLMCFAAVWTYFYFMFPFICSRSFELLILGIPGFLLLLTNVDFNNHWPMKMEIITRSKESLRAGYYCTPYCNWRLAFFLGREPQLLGVFQQVNKKDWIDEPPNIEPFVHFGWRAGCEGELTHITHAFFFLKIGVPLFTSDFPRTWRTWMIYDDLVSSIGTPVYSQVIPNLWDITTVKSMPRRSDSKARPFLEEERVLSVPSSFCGQQGRH